MRQLAAFCKKEWTQMLRQGKFMVLLIIFILFGIMNPAMAKLTPWLFEQFSDSFAEQGITVTEMTVDALTSWGQFYKNLSMALIVIVIMLSGILVSEYQKGTLINMLTKGLSRWKVIASKSFIMIVIWTICYWISYLITYGYNAYFWDNSIADHVFYGAFCVYLFGIWLISLIMLGSAIFHTNSAVLLAVAAPVAVFYLLAMIPDLTEYLPTQLMNTGNLLTKAAALNQFNTALIITLILSILNYIAAVVFFNHKQL